MDTLPVYRILVVDSSLLVVDRIQRLLEEMGNAKMVSRAYTYSDAIEKVNREVFDVVLLDTQINGGNGFQLLSYIRANYPSTKTIVVTNQSGALYRQKAQEIGTDHFIDKSSEFEKITDILRLYAVEMN